jgi:hypothetical protein
MNNLYSVSLQLLLAYSYLLPSSFTLPCSALHGLVVYNPTPAPHNLLEHPLYANMIPSFKSLRVFLLLLFICSVFASDSTPKRRSRVRVWSPPSTEAHLLVRRAAPSGWTLYVKSGNDGGGCYVDSQTRVLTGYSGSSSTNSLDSCLNTCRTKGFSYGGVEVGNQCFVSLRLITSMLTSSAVVLFPPTSLRLPRANVITPAKPPPLIDAVEYGE